MSRDGENILIASYADLRRCVETAFNELQIAAVQTNNHNHINAAVLGRR